MQTAWPRPGLVGVQEPRISWQMPGVAVDFSVSETGPAIEGRRLPPWQSMVVREGTAKRADGKWAAYEVCVLCSRQNGKNGSLEQVVIDWMTSEPGVQILYTAHEFATAVKTMEKLIALITGDPKLSKLLAPRQPRRGNGRESITFKNGSMIAFRTRTKQGGRGGSFDRLIVDEAMICTPEALAALTPLLTTAENPQIWYLGSAADADSQPHCGQWALLRSRALEGGDTSLLWFEWSAPGPPENATRAEVAAWRDDPANWAAANPSLGYLFDEEYIANEQKTFRAQLEKWEIERLSVGRWPKPAEEHEPVVDLDVWAGMADHGRETEVRVSGPIALAIDMNLQRTVCAISAATRLHGDERIRIEVGYYGPPTDLLERLADLVDRWDPCVLVINSSSPAAALKPKLEQLGIEPELTTAAQSAQAAGGFVDDALAGRLSHADDDRLNASLAGAVPKHMSGGAMGWDYTASDVLALQTVCLARWGLLTFGTEKRAPQTPLIDDDHGTAVDDDELMTVGF